MAVSSHGGYCCGIKHVYQFPSFFGDDALSRQKAWLKEAVRRVLRPNGRSRNLGQLVEVALTDGQMVQWSKTLKDFGFKHVARWKNGNSGNHVNLLTYQPKQRLAAQPFEF